MKNKQLIMISALVLIIGFLIGFSITTIINKSNTPQLGTIYLTADEIQYGPGLKEKTGANVVVLGLFGETIDDLIKRGNIENII